MGCSALRPGDMSDSDAIVSVLTEWNNTAPSEPIDLSQSKMVSMHGRTNGQIHGHSTDENYPLDLSVNPTMRSPKGQGHCQGQGHTLTDLTHGSSGYKVVSDCYPHHTAYEYDIRPRTSSGKAWNPGYYSCQYTAHGSPSDCDKGVSSYHGHTSACGRSDPCRGLYEPISYFMEISEPGGHHHRGTPAAAHQHNHEYTSQSRYASSTTAYQHINGYITHGHGIYAYPENRDLQESSYPRKQRHGKTSPYSRKSPDTAANSYGDVTTKHREFRPDGSSPSEAIKRNITYSSGGDLSQTEFTPRSTECRDIGYAQNGVSAGDGLQSNHHGNRIQTNKHMSLDDFLCINVDVDPSNSKYVKQSESRILDYHLDNKQDKGDLISSNTHYAGGVVISDNTKVKDINGVTLEPIHIPLHILAKPTRIESSPKTIIINLDPPAPASVICDKTDNANAEREETISV